MRVSKIYSQNLLIILSSTCEQENERTKNKLCSQCLDQELNPYFGFATTGCGLVIWHKKYNVGTDCYWTLVYVMISAHILTKLGKRLSKRNGLCQRNLWIYQKMKHFLSPPATAYHYPFEKQKEDNNDDDIEKGKEDNDNDDGK